MSDWHTSTDGLWAKAWALFTDASQPRYIALATIGASGPANRLVVLRDADPQAAELMIYTDAASVKVGELQADPRAALAYWRSADALQVRLEGRIQITTGQALADGWQTLAPHQKGNYGVMPPPGSAIDASDAYSREPDFDKFAQLTFTAETIDIVHLSRDHHRRALYSRDTHWAGQWRAP